MSTTSKKGDITPKRSESLERLQNQLYQAQANGDTAMAKKIKLIIDRIKGLKN